jgi:hypothetical protein
MSIDVEVADALAAGISAKAWAGPYGTVTARRLFVPDYTMEDLTTLKVSVVPGTIEIMNAVRGADMFDLDIHVVIAKHLDEDAEADDLVDLRTQIVDAIRSGTVPTPGMPDGVKWLSIAYGQTFDRDSLTEKRTFTADIAVTYKVALSKVTS